MCKGSSRDSGSALFEPGVVLVKEDKSLTRGKRSGSKSGLSNRPRPGFSVRFGDEDITYFDHLAGAYQNVLNSPSDVTSGPIHAQVIRVITAAVKAFTAATADCHNRALPLICHRWALLVDHNAYSMKVTAPQALVSLWNTVEFFFGDLPSPSLSPHLCKYPGLLSR
ncbi:hypothetical protein LZ32DRAFT_412343 [Colletotrichum eremochloae]|nr:hypothetical protein LZ32DRAFT_412343 [Colletotrichum eremochloae]